MVVPRSRRPGRPLKSDGDVRRRLPESASRLIAERGFRGVGTREIARSADASPAMIAYYFGDKPGLLTAILDSLFDRLIEEVGTHVMASPDDVSVAETFVRAYVGLISREPWIPQLIVREVLSNDGPLRAHFAERFAARAARVIPPLFTREVEEGRLRKDLDPMLGLLSLVGMCVFPFLAHPMVGDALGYELDERFAERLIAHTSRLYLDGARGEQR